MTQKKRRLFIATNAIGIKNLMEGLDDETATTVSCCFGGFYQSIEGKNGRPEVVQKASAYYDDKNHAFVEYVKPSPNQASLILISDKMGLDEFNQLFKVGKSDYLIAHIGIDKQGTDAGIVELFDPNHVKNSHHMQGYAHAEAFNAIFNSIKAAASLSIDSLIDGVWAQDKSFRKEAQRLFSLYYVARPKEDECPKAFRSMKAHFNELKTCDEACYFEKLRAFIKAFDKKYYN